MYVLVVAGLVGVDGPTVAASAAVLGVPTNTNSLTGWLKFNSTFVAVLVADCSWTCSIKYSCDTWANLRLSSVSKYI